MNTTEITTRSSHSYWDWVPSQRTIAKTGIAIAGIAMASSAIMDSTSAGIASAAAAVFGLAYLWVAKDDSNFGVISDAQLSKPAIHIPQVHWRPEFKNNPDASALCYISQLKVLEQLLRYPEAAVFKESLLGTSHYSEAFVHMAEMIFPNGIPKKDDPWTELQRKFLAEKGAATVLHLLGIINTLYRSIDPTTSAKLSEKIEQELSMGRSPYESPLKELLFDRREEALVKEIREFLKNPKNKNRQIIIVFGEAHDLCTGQKIS